MVYKLRSRYFISPARIMGSIKQEEQEVGFYTSFPPGTLSYHKLFLQEMRKRFSACGGFSSSVFLDLALTASVSQEGAQIQKRVPRCEMSKNAFNELNVINYYSLFR